MSKEWDLFFYYGKADLQEEIKQDILNGLGTSKEKLFFNRVDSAGLNGFENSPNTLSTQIFIKYNIAKWIAYRNSYTGNGVNGKKERRIAVSQEDRYMNITQDKEGNMDVNIFYIPFVNYNQNKTISIPIGG